MFSETKSIWGFKMTQVFTDGAGYDQFYPMERKDDMELTLTLFIQDAGIPPVLVSDNAPEEIHGQIHETCQKYRIKQEQVVPHSPWQNLAEAAICEIKVGIHKVLRCTQALKCTWCYAGTWVAAVR